MAHTSHRRIVFQSRICLFNLRVFLEFVKCLFKVSNISFDIVFDYSAIFVEDDCVSGFTFIREERFHSLQEFFSVRNISTI